jgi:hypothetical protein
MTITLTNAVNTNNNRIVATGTLTWTTLGTTVSGDWSNWTRWNYSPNNITVKVQEDAGSIATRLPLIALTYDGELSVTLKIANTVDSTNTLVSPTITTLTANTEFSPVKGRYYEYTLTISTDSAFTVPQLQTPSISFSDDRITDLQEEVSTATLGGTIDARPVATDLIGTVTGCIITAQEEGVTYSSGQLQDRQYAIPDNYTFQENAIVTNVVSKVPLKIRCFDLNGESIDAVVDIQIYGLSEIRQGTEGIIAA